MPRDAGRNSSRIGRAVWHVDEIEPTEAGKTAPLDETANEKASEPAATELKRAKRPEKAATEPKRAKQPEKVIDAMLHRYHIEGGFLY